MKTIRRIYFYLVSLISVLTLIWGITNLLRSIVNPHTTGNQSSILSAGLAQILVSLPILLLHWLVVQRDAQKSEEEKNSLIRALFMYGILIGTLIPVIQNFMAFLNRLLLQTAQLNPERAVFGGFQTIPDNLIAIVVNLVLAAYFYRILKSDWAGSSDTTNLIDIRRLYRYVWMLYGLGLSIFGIQRLIMFVMTWQERIGTSGRELFGNGVTLLIAGVPLWVIWWNTIQNANDDKVDAHTMLRTIVLYLLYITGAITFSVNSGWILYWFLRLTLGEVFSQMQVLDNLRIPVSLAIPFGVYWAYFAGILEKDISIIPDTVRQAAMRRLYRYILSTIGLGGTIIGLIGTLGFIIDLVTKHTLSSQTKYSTLAGNLAVLVVGIAIWLVFWGKANQESVITGEEGDHARRSLSRKIYLYLVIFGCVIGTMASTGYFLFRLLQSVFGFAGTTLLSDSLNDFRLVVVFAAFLAYHLVTLNRDNRTLSKHLAERQETFGVLALFDAESTIGKGLSLAFQRHASRIPLKFASILDLRHEDLDKTDAVILDSGQMISNLGDIKTKLNDYPGKQIVIPSVDQQQTWIALPMKEQDVYRNCAQLTKAMAEGQTVKVNQALSAWMIISYVIAGLLGLQILAVLVSLLLNGM